MKMNILGINLGGFRKNYVKFVLKFEGVSNFETPLVVYLQARCEQIILSL